MKYEHGVEYPTNGVKPDLPDDVLVEFNGKRGAWDSGHHSVCSWLWAGSSAFRIVDDRYKPKTSDTSVSIANLLNAQVSIANARKSSEFSEHNSELADQADAILQAIIGNLKAERIPAEALYHMANAQNELSACAKLLEGDKALADAVFCIGEKLAGIRKGEL